MRPREIFLILLWINVVIVASISITSNTFSFESFLNKDKVNLKIYHGSLHDISSTEKVFFNFETGTYYTHDMVGEGQIYLENGIIKQADQNADYAIVPDFILGRSPYDKDNYKQLSYLPECKATKGKMFLVEGDPCNTYAVFKIVSVQPEHVEFVCVVYTKNNLDENKS